jgi:hypothetical protein
VAEDELARLRAEVAELRSQLDRKQGRQRRLAVARSCAAAVLAALSALGVVVSMVGVWATWTALDTDRWVATVAILDGDSQVIAATGDEVRIELLPVLNQVLRQLEQQLPTLFGHRLDLPDITSGEVPPQLRTIVGNALGVTLPADFARFTVYRGDELRRLQEGVVLAKRWLYGVIAATVVALGAALWMSPTRRRTLLQFGVWLVVWVVAVSAAMRAVKAQVLAQVPAGVYRSAAGPAVTAVFSGLHRSGIGLLAAGYALAVLAYLVGPEDDCQCGCGETQWPFARGCGRWCAGSGRRAPAGSAATSTCCGWPVSSSRRWWPRCCRRGPDCSSWRQFSAYMN